MIRVAPLLPDRPADIGKVLDAGFRLWLKTLRPEMLVLLFIPALLQALPGLLQPLEIEPLISAARRGELDLPPLSAWMPALLVQAIAQLVTLFAASSLVLWQHAFATGAPVSLGTVWNRLLARAAVLPVVGLVVAVAVLMGALAALIGAVLVFVYLYFATYVVVLEPKCGPLAALARSIDLSQRQFWRISLVLTLPFAVQMALGSVTSTLALLSIVPTFISATDPLAVVAPLLTRTTWLTVPVVALTLPLWTAVGVVLFHDLKLRRDGADLLERILARKPA
jgi:hypothetical protein